MKSKILLVIRKEDQYFDLITKYLDDFKCEIFIEETFAAGIQCAQKNFYDVILLDTKIKGMEINQVIKILNNLDPQVKIIVKTDSSSKNFEAKIRKEKIYYYHIDSFDLSDLKLAIKSAIEHRRIA